VARHDKYFPGSAVSRYLKPGETGFSQVVHQAARPVLDSELNLDQELRTHLQSVLAQRRIPSGWLRGQSRADAYADFSFDPPWLAGPTLNPAFTADSFHLRKLQAIVAGHLVDVEYTNTDAEGDNLIILDPASRFDGTPPTFKRTDFVWLEVWLKLISDSANAEATLTVVSPVTAIVGDTVTVAGFVLTGIAPGPPPLPTEFTIDPASATITAASLAAQIIASVPAVTVQVTGNSLRVIAATSGTAGNAITISSTGVGLPISPGTGFLAGGVDEPGKPSEDLIYRHGNIQSSTTVALPDDIADPALSAETSKRVQVQYCIRHSGVAEGINFKIDADGFSNPAVLAQGPQPAPVALYPFVPADLKSTRDNSDARDQVAGTGIGYGVEDTGLWIAGDGTLASATDLGTVDGYVYALPICFAFRRNDAEGGAGFAPLANTNGALAHDHAPFVNPALYSVVDTAESDRPDKAFHDAIRDNDLLDLRRHTSFQGADLAAELQHQMKSLLDGNFRTWAIDAADKNELGAGSGDVSTRFLVCNQVGRTETNPPGLNGVAPLSGDTTRGDTIRNFDHVARRFGDQSVVERFVISFVPGDDFATNPGRYVTRAGFAAAFAGWAEGDVLELDLAALNATTLGDFDVAFASLATGNVFDFMPAGTQITDVLSVFHDDGNYDSVEDQTVKPTLIAGLGTEHVSITLDANATQVNAGLDTAGVYHDMVGTLISGDVGSSRRIFLEVEVTYPLGVGTTDTPDLEVVQDADPYPYGPLIENDITLAQRPPDMENPLAPNFRSGFREVHLEYIARDATGGVANAGAPVGAITTETLVSRNDLELVLGRRAFGSTVSTIGVTDQQDAGGRTINTNLTDYGSSSRLVTLLNSGGGSAVPLSGAGQTQVAVTFFAQDAVPNYGPAGAGYQVGVYYRSNAPQTAGVKEGTMTTGGVSDFPYTGATGPLPEELLIEPLVMAGELWTGTVGMGSVELPFPYFAPLDQIPINDGSTSPVPPAPGDEFPGEWYFAATANISIDDFDAQTGLLALHPFVQADGTQEYQMGGVNIDEVPFKDAEFRAAYPVINKDAYRPTVFSQPLSGVVRHKVFMPFLAKARADSVLYRKDELLLVVISRWAALDENNTVRFVDTDSGNRTCAGVYRTRSLLLTAGNGE